MKDIHTFKFWKHKYGPIRRHPTFTETFYSVTIVLDADETISVDGTPGHIGHGSVVTSIPGEVWQFSPQSQLKGFNLAFEKEFLLAFFNDPHFLNRLIRRTLGFETSTYFIRSFGKRYGVTPLQYRKSNKE